MRICHLILSEIAPVSSWAEFEETYPSVCHLLQALRKTALQPIWIAPSRESACFRCNGIIVFLVAPEPGKTRPRLFAPSGESRQFARILQVLAEAGPDVVHVHGLMSAHLLRRLSDWVLAHRVGFVVQDHAGGCPGTPWGRHAFQEALAAVDVALFGDAQARQKWIDGGMLLPEQTAELFTASSPFRPVARKKRAELRHQRNLRGRPIFGWVGHLDENKDPLTVLQAFRHYFELNPNGRLYMHYKKDTLLQQCRAYVTAEKVLERCVIFKGEARFQDLEEFYQSLDYFVLGSHHEAYGLAVVEAMSAGVIPVVTDIPGFRLITNDGEYGHLFPPGDAATLQDILISLPAEADEEERRAVRRHFEQELSYPVIAERLKAIYKNLPRRTAK